MQPVEDRKWLKPRRQLMLETLIFIGNQDDVFRDQFKKKERDFPGGAVVKNPPANAGDTGSSPSPGRSHMPRSN